MTLDTLSQKATARAPMALVATDVIEWSKNFAAGYEALGWQCAVGLENFFLESLEADIVHLNWPEEYTRWRIPTDSSIDHVAACLDRWRRRSKIILTVNNLLPHNQPHHPQWRKLYLEVYRRVDVIHHLSQYSKDATCIVFPEATPIRHVVQSGFNYARLLERDQFQNREGMSLSFKRRPGDFFLLSFGALRSWSELWLLVRGFHGARVKGKKLIVASQFQAENPNSMLSLCQKTFWRIWTRHPNIIRMRGRVPDGELQALFDACDALLVVREAGLTSGLPSLAMTFGCPVIAARIGSTPEILGDLGNAIYDPSSSADLSRAIERMVQTDRALLRFENKRRAAQWNWETSIGACLSTLGFETTTVESSSG